MNGQQLTLKQELQVRRAAAKHLRGIPARQNASRMDELQTLIDYEALVERVGAEEIARWSAMEESCGLR